MSKVRNIKLKVKLIILCIYVFAMGGYGLLCGTVGMGYLTRDAMTFMGETVEQSTTLDQETKAQIQEFKTKLNNDKNTRQHRFFIIMTVLFILTLINLIYIILDVIKTVKEDTEYAILLANGDFSKDMKEQNMDRLDEPWCTGPGVEPDQDQYASTCSSDSDRGNESGWCCKCDKRESGNCCYRCRRSYRFNTAGSQLEMRKQRHQQSR